MQNLGFSTHPVKNRAFSQLGLQVAVAIVTSVFISHHAFGHAGHHSSKAKSSRSGQSATQSETNVADTAIKPVSPSVSFVEPVANAKVKSPVKVVMRVEGYEIGPLGDLTEGKGHHHLIIDKEPIAKGQVVPVDAQHIHFGKGQTETEVKLSPGKHRLTLQFADGAHRSYGPELSSTIEIEVLK